jgi:dihydroorotate dehydrogenase
MSAIFTAYPLVRRALFAMDPEAAHEATMSALQKAYDCRFTRALSHQLPLAPTILMGLSLKNPVGLAAGLDKDGAHIDALGNLGFGFIEVGTVTPRPQPGNPKPRMFRLPESEALINRLGFNNHGLTQFLQNVARSEYRRHGGILGLNIGKNADTPIENAADDYLIGLDGVYPHADYITINISSPNTKNLRDLQSSDALDALLGALNARRQLLAEQHKKAVPLTVKIAPDVDSDQLQTIAQALVKHAIDGVIATNTTISRQGVEGQRHAQEAGGLSGTPVHEKSLLVIRQLRALLGPTFPIIGVGGVVNGQQAAEKIQAGANAVQIYTGLIYRGPGLIPEAVKAISALQNR